MDLGDLLPTAGIGGEGFEAFLADLLKRMERIPGAYPRVAYSSRRGKSGQEQGGVDHDIVYSDGSRAVLQAKEQASLTKAHITTIVNDVKDAGETAARRIIAYSRTASASARREIRHHEGWEIWDQNDLTDLVRSLLVHDQRALLDVHFGPDVRRGFLKIGGNDAFIPLETYFAPTLTETIAFHHRSTLLGRDADLSTLVDAVSEDAGPKVVVVAGPAGRGKTRLVLEMLRRIGERLYPATVLVRAEGHVLNTSAFDELPAASVVILVEDAHRDMTELPGLLQYVRRTPGARLVVTLRSAGSAQLRQALAAALFQPAETVVHSLAPLPIGAARELVSQLRGDDVELEPAFAEQMARTAQATPFVAVVAIGMIRRGELSTALTLNVNVQQQVMHRYGQVTTDGIPGVTAVAVREALALIAALGPVSLKDEALLDAMAVFLGTDRRGFLTTIQTLTEHGVLLQRGWLVQVVPDLLADEILAGEAVLMGADSGFTKKIWLAFPDRANTLLPNLAALDWRLHQTASTGGGGTFDVDVFSPVWADIRERVIAGDHWTRLAHLDTLSVPAAVQSRRVFELLQEMIAQPGGDVSDEDGGSFFTHERVCHACVRHVETCATSDSSLLPAALDLLWKLARSDDRPAHSNPDHPVRAVERIAGLGKPGAMLVAGVVIDRVTAWLQTEPSQDAVRSPLFALEPLLSKEGYSTHWQLNAIGMRPYLVDPAELRPIRDRIRQLLAPIMVGPDIRRAVDATRILAAAIEAPHGLFGKKVSEETVAAWKDDDQATLTVLRSAAHGATEPMVRIELRRTLPLYASAPASALHQDSRKLLESIDAHDEDLITRLLAVPDYARYEGDQAARDVSADDDPSADYERAVQRGDTDRQRAAQELWASYPEAAGLVTLLAERLTAAAGTTDDYRESTDAFLRAVAADPGHAVVFAETIIAGEPSPLDDWIHAILDGLVHQDRPAFLRMLTAAMSGRPSLVAGALRGFTRARWAAVADEAATLIIEAAHSPQPEIVAAATAATGALLRTNPAVTAPRLRQLVSKYPGAVEIAVAVAVGADGAAWVESMGEGAQKALLKLIAELPTWNGRIYPAVKALAQCLREQFIRALATRSENYNLHGPRVGWGIDQEFTKHPDALVGWIEEASARTGIRRRHAADVWPVVAGNPVSEGTGTAVTRLAASGTAEHLKFLAESLAEVEGFVLDRPDLVTILVVSLQGRDSVLRNDACGYLLLSGMPRGTSRTPGEPAQENLTNRDRAADLAAREDLPDAVRELYRQMGEALQNQIDADLESDRREDEGL